MSLLLMFLEDFPTSVIVVFDLSVGPLVGAVVQVKRKSVKSVTTKREVKRNDGRMEETPRKKFSWYIGIENSEDRILINRGQKYIPTTALSVTYITFYVKL
jgi:hypothetical protein